jgi:hypothetical protein
MSLRSFKGTAFYMWKANKPYRIYARGGRVFFIRRPHAGPNTRAAVVMASQFGMLGGLAGAAGSAFRGEKAGQLVADDDPTPPEELLPGHPDNFALAPAEMLNAHIEAPGKYVSYGPHAGRWHFTRPRGEETVVLFDQPSQVGAAIAQLAGVLGSALRINAVVDPGSGKYRAGEGTLPVVTPETGEPETLVTHVLPAEQAELVRLMQELTGLLAKLAPPNCFEFNCEIHAAAPGGKRPLRYLVGDPSRPAEQLTDPGNDLHLAASRLVRKMSPSIRSFPGLLVRMKRLEGGGWQNNVRVMS